MCVSVQLFRVPLLRQISLIHLHQSGNWLIKAAINVDSRYSRVRGRPLLLDSNFYRNTLHFEVGQDLRRLDCEGVIAASRRAVHLSKRAC